MKNQKSFVFAFLTCLSICLSSCSEKGYGCYTVDIDVIATEKIEVMQTHAVTIEATTVAD